MLAGTYGRGIWSLDFGPTPQPTRFPVNDFDGDGRSDIAVVRPTGTPGGFVWHTKMSTAGYDSTLHGDAGDDLAPADYDGDGKTDIAVFQSSKGEFHILRSTDSVTDVVGIGDVGDIPVPGDFDGDGMDDPAVFRPSTAYWYVQQSTNGSMSAQWGGNDDTPVTADFDGDGHADMGVFQLKNGGYWELFYVTVRGTDEIQFGLEGDVPTVGDYDADGKADIAIWRPDDDEEGNGCWYVLYSSSDYEDYDVIPWGVSTDVPVPGDYDGDGKTDVAVWRPGDGIWRILASSNGYFSPLFGAEGDTPVGGRVVYGSRPSGQHFTKAPPTARPQRRAESSPGADDRRRIRSVTQAN